MQNLKNTLKQLANPEKADHSKRFFKTGPGEYGEGDMFLGITVPELRKLSRQYKDLPLEYIEILLKSPMHEERLLGLFILVLQYKQSSDPQIMYDFYVEHLDHVNNWDLVDSSAPYISGHFLFKNDKDIIYEWVQDQNMWIRRIAMLTTFYFIKNNEFTDALNIAEILHLDHEDLIHKAVGWMLREIGKRDLPIEEQFLQKYYKNMPRTMLRYAIEKFPEPKRQAYLKGAI